MVCVVKAAHKWFMEELRKLEKGNEDEVNNRISRAHEITHLLSSMGVPNSYLGVQQAACAVELVLEEPACLNLVTKRLYPEVALRTHTTATSVERNIRTVVQLVWENHPTVLHSVAGYELRRKPTTSQFIAILVDYVQRTQ